MVVCEFWCHNGKWIWFNIIVIFCYGLLYHLTNRSKRISKKLLGKIPNSKLKLFNLQMCLKFIFYACLFLRRNYKVINVIYFCSISVYLHLHNVFSSSFIVFLNIYHFFKFQIGFNIFTKSSENIIKVG
jgi:hypothetical protein